MKNITISICKIDQIDQVMRYIHENWKADHILSKHKELMDYQHYDRYLHRYNWVLALDGETLVGILGFIPENRYDPLSKIIHLAIWKSEILGVGMMMLKFLKSLYPDSQICAVGINDQVEKLYVALGYQTGILDHLLFDGKFEPNPDIFQPRQIIYTNKYGYGQPFRKYKYVIRNNVVFVYRIITITGLRFLRIFDIFKVGNIKITDRPFQEEGQIDFMDCFVGGIDKEPLLQIGFSDIPEGMICPTFTEPVIMSNLTIQYAHEPGNPVIMFKGHSDQDRINLIEK